MDKQIVDDEQTDSRPTPDDFFNYLPWACNQLQLDCTVVITKVFQNEYVSPALADKNKKIRAKQTASRNEIASDHDKEEKSTSGLPQLLADQNIIRIYAMYDTFDNLVEIKFDNNKQIPRLVLKIIGLIVQFQMHVTRITINGGMDMYTIYEVNKFLNMTNITEVCLDNSFLKEANYDILFENKNNIRYLSLSKCKLEDNVIENIAKKLIYPLPASTCLSVLIVSSNRITDKGVQSLAVALKSNRHLSYISLADNRLTDDGACLIMDSLIEFPLTCDELINARHRCMRYLKDKNDMIHSMIRELRASEFDRKSAKRKSVRPVSAALSAKKGKLDKESSMKSLGDTKSNANIDYLFHDKAVNLVEERLGEFNDPYSNVNLAIKDGVMYCKGNNALCYLSLAYNSLSYVSLKKLLNVLTYQKLLDRRPRGLINVSIEGNCLPITCKELTMIDDLLESGLMAHSRRASGSKKRPPSKNTPR